MKFGLYADRKDPRIKGHSWPHTVRHALTDTSECTILILGDEPIPIIK